MGASNNPCSRTETYCESSPAFRYTRKSPAPKAASFARNDILPVRLTAIEILAQLGVREALPALEEVAAYNGDSDIRHAARLAIETIQRLSY